MPSSIKLKGKTMEIFETQTTNAYAPMMEEMEKIREIPLDDLKFSFTMKEIRDILIQHKVKEIRSYFGINHLHKLVSSLSLEIPEGSYEDPYKIIVSFIVKEVKT